MRKYLGIFRISFLQEFAYRLNFIMWRVRNVLQIFITFFLWSTVFEDSEKVIFGYNRGGILTYIFGILVIRAIVFSARTVDVANEIAKGDLSNYLLKPIGYFRTWLTRDLSSKALNLVFAFFETIILYLILRPPIFLQTNPWLILAFIISLIIAVMLFFYILFLINMVAFWVPEMGWALQFLLVVIITEFLSGALFPIDILPRVAQTIIYALPFPYLIFFPLQIYIGKLSSGAIINGLAISLAWTVIFGFFMNFVWKRGLKHYAAEGR
jgi:ABC-2 type transport system permease protein